MTWKQQPGRRTRSTSLGGGTGSTSLGGGIGSTHLEGGTGSTSLGGGPGSTSKQLYFPILVLYCVLIELQQLSFWWIPNTRKFSFWLDKTADESHSVLAMPCLLVQLYLVPCYTACKQGSARWRRSVQAMHCAFNYTNITLLHYYVC